MHSQQKCKKKKKKKVYQEEEKKESQMGCLMGDVKICEICRTLAWNCWNAIMLNIISC